MIESIQNEKIKYLSRLITDNRFRKKNHVFVVEGNQENQRALQFGFEPVEFFIAENIFKGKEIAGKSYFVSEKVYDKIAYRGTSEGIIGIYKVKPTALKNFHSSEHSSLIVVEGVEKPGNLGAIMRSCEAFGIDALVVTDVKADFYNPNVIRSSVGCIFGLNFFQTSNEELYEFLKNNQYQIFTTIMDDNSEPLYNRNFGSKSAIVFGTEHSGLTEFWTGKGENTLIPTSGTIDSLNLSNAVAIACYEIMKQKKG